MTWPINSTANLPRNRSWEARGEARNIYRNNLLIFDRGGRGTVIAGHIEESRGTFRQLAQVSLFQAEPFKPAVIAKASP